MGVVNVKSTPLTNRDAIPRVLNNAIVEGGVVREIVAKAFVTTGDSSTSTFRLARIPSNARPSYLRLYGPDLGTTTAFHLGLYSESTADSTGTAVDADFFASDFSIAAITAGTDVIHEADASPGYQLSKAEMPLWEALGLASDPGVNYELVATLNGTADGSGTLVAKLGYVI
jgi:hypothetical protein